MVEGTRGFRLSKDSLGRVRKLDRVCSSSIVKVNNLGPVVSDLLWSDGAILDENTTRTLPSGSTDPARSNFKKTARDWRLLRGKQRHKWSNLLRLEHLPKLIWNN